MKRSLTKGLCAALLPFLTLAFVLLVCGRAAAEGKGKKIAVLVEGPEAEAVRAAVVAVVSPRVEVVQAPVFARALAQNGQRGAIGPVLTSARKRTKPVERIRKAAGAVGADAVIVGRTRKAADGLRVWLLWLTPGSSDPPVDEEVAQRGSAEERRAAIQKILGGALDELAPAAAPAPAPPKETAPAREEAPAPPAAAPPAPPAAVAAPADARPARTPHQVGTAIVVLGLEFAIGGRRFAYTDGLSPNVRDYNVFGPPMPQASLEIYPAAATGVPVVRDLGLTASYARAFGISSQTKGGTAVNTSWDRLITGLRFRLRPGSDEGPVLGAHGGFGMIRFGFQTADKDLAASVPDVAYLFLHGGLDARIPFWRLALLLDADYDGALSAGKVFQRFRGAQVGGIDAGAGLAVVFGAGFEARLRAGYTRYFYAFDPNPGDAYIAGGALDEFLTVGLGIFYAY